VTHDYHAAGEETERDELTYTLEKKKKKKKLLFCWIRRRTAKVSFSLDRSLASTQSTLSNLNDIEYLRLAT
jgi:hypothetical protein